MCLGSSPPEIKIPEPQPIEVPPVEIPPMPDYPEPSPPAPPPAPSAATPVINVGGPEGQGRTGLQSGKAKAQRRGTSSLRIDLNLPDTGGVSGLNIPTG